MRLWGFLSCFCPLVLECLGVKSGMSFLLRKPCKTGSTWSITASPQRMSFLGMSNWGGCFSMALGAGVVRGPNVNWPLPPGRFLQGSISCCVVSNSLTRDSLCDAEVRAVVASRCWQCPAGRLSRWWCLCIQYHCDFPLGNLFLLLSCWGLCCSPREGPTATRWTWLGWAGPVPCWGPWLPFLRDVPSF